MKVRCKKKSGYYQFLVIPYNLELDNEDVASSEGVIDGEIRYLLQDDHGYPGFFPSSLFEVLQSGLPLDWEIAEYHFRKKTMLVIGYSNLVNQYSHLRGILLLQPNDVKIFLRTKERLWLLGHRAEVPKRNK